MSTETNFQKILRRIISEEDQILINDLYDQIFIARDNNNFWACRKAALALDRKLSELKLDFTRWYPQLKETVVDGVSKKEVFLMIAEPGERIW